MSEKERPAKTYFKKMYENEFYEVHFKELKGTLVASSSDLWDLMEGFADQEKKLYLGKVLEEVWKLIIVADYREVDAQVIMGNITMSRACEILSEKAKERLLNHLKQKQ